METFQRLPGVLYLACFGTLHCKSQGTNKSKGYLPSHQEVYCSPFKPGAADLSSPLAVPAAENCADTAPLLLKFPLHLKYSLPKI